MDTPVAMSDMIDQSKISASSAKPNIKQVADILGVSIMTVSRAMRGVEGVSEATRQKVLKVAKQIGYKPNYNARSLAVAKSRLIGVSFPTLFDEVFAEIFDGARLLLERSGFDLITETSNYDLDVEDAWVDRMLKWSPAGLILTGCTHKKGLAKRIRDAAVPVVEIWDCTEDPVDVCVGIDHEEVGRLSADLLLNCGYRHCCMIGLPEHKDPRADKRFQSFAQLFGQIGKVSCHRVDARPTFEAGHHAVLELHREQPNSFDCFYFLNDHLAFGGLCGLEALGVSVPEKAGVMGFNNLGINTALNRKITTINTERRTIGELAASRLLARINGVETQQLSKIPVNIIAGDTTRQVK